MAERGGSELPTWLTPVTDGRCVDEGYVTGSRDGRAGECPGGVLLEGVAGPQQLGRRYELVVQSATTTVDGWCVPDTDADKHDAFSIEVVPGTRSAVCAHRNTTHYYSLASPAMGHWGTCPLDLQQCIFFSAF